MALAQTPPTDEIQALANGSTATPHSGAWGFDLAGMDMAIKPVNNFYDYADGAATAAIRIPPDLSGCARSAGAKFSAPNDALSADQQFLRSAEMTAASKYLVCPLRR